MPTPTPFMDYMAGASPTPATFVVTGSRKPAPKLKTANPAAPDCWLLKPSGFRTTAACWPRIQETGNIFSAISDKDWILDGANVHISIICFDDGAETIRSLDGRPVDIIHTDLTAGADLTQARKLPENANISFAGDKKHGDFQIDQATAAEMLNRYNPNGKPNSDVVKPWLIGHDVNQKPGNRWIIDFGVAMPESEAAMYEAPFEYVRRNVKPKRDKHRAPRLRRYWWLHGAPRIAMRQALTGLPRYIVSSQVSKHRMFSWVDGHILPDATLIVFARDDDYFFGLLHSRIHAVWAAALGTQRRESVSGKRYIISTCFETFPFPNPTKEQQTAIAAAALELNTMRANALRDPQRTLTALYNNPPEMANQRPRRPRRRRSRRLQPPLQPGRRRHPIPSANPKPTTQLITPKPANKPTHPATAPPPQQSPNHPRETPPDASDDSTATTLQTRNRRLFYPIIPESTTRKRHHNKPIPQE